MNEIGLFVRSRPVLEIVILCLIADVIFGILRAFKECQMNSSFGIGGLIKKIGMVVCLVFLVFVDQILALNLIGFLPEEWLQVIGLKQVGLTDFFGIVFILNELLSVLKNMVLIGVPIPKKIKEKIENFLYTMTDEMPKK